MKLVNLIEKTCIASSLPALALLMTGATSWADEFSGASPSLDEGNTPRYTDTYIQAQIHKDMVVACDGDRCELASSTSSGHKFTVNLSSGMGNPSNNTGTGSVVVIGNSPTTSSSSEPFVTLTLQYTYQKCTQVVNVPKSLYVAMNTYIYHLMNEDGSTKRNFSPSENTMILFYTTILNQAKGCAGS